jgi:type IV pilus assembly protein PilA
MSRRREQYVERHASNDLRGFTLIELLVVVAIILIIAAIAIPSFLRARMAANEASAATMVRAVGTAATVYSTTWDNGYPPSLTALGGPGPAATCDQAVLLDPLLTTAPYIKSGYKFAYNGVGPAVTSPAGCGAPGYDAYLVTATPTVPGYSGMRSFCSDLPGVIHYDLTGATAASTAACDILPAMQ